MTMKSNSDDWYKQNAQFDPSLDLPPEIERELGSKYHPSLSEIEGLLQEHDYDLIIFGLRMKSKIKSVRVGNLILYPQFNLGHYLKGYEKTAVDFIVDRKPIFAKYRTIQPLSRMHLFSPKIEDDCLIHFRLYKPGWISAVRVTPVVKVKGKEVGRGELGWVPQLWGQTWADPMVYDVDLNDIRGIRKTYNDLLAMPQGYLELALRRFSKSYNYYEHSEYLGISELDDCLVDLVIALESLTSKSSDSVQQSIILRSALLTGKTHEDLEKIGHLVKQFYGHRSNIVHGDSKNKDKISEKEYGKRFEELESFRSFTRSVVNASIAVLKKECRSDRGLLSDSVPGVIDDYLLNKIQHK